MPCPDKKQKRLKNYYGGCIIPNYASQGIIFQEEETSGKVILRDMRAFHLWIDGVLVFK